MQDPDHWYQEKADELAHWEIEIIDHMKADRSGSWRQGRYPVDSSSNMSLSSATSSEPSGNGEVAVSTVR